MSRSECVACGEIFNSVKAFDRHRIGGFGEAIYKPGSKKKSGADIIGYTKPNRRCMTSEEMAAIGMSKNEKGWWITEVRKPATWGKRSSQPAGGKQR